MKLEKIIRVCSENAPNRILNTLTLHSVLIHMMYVGDVGGAKKYAERTHILLNLLITPIELSFNRSRKITFS